MGLNESGAGPNSRLGGGRLKSGLIEYGIRTGLCGNDLTSVEASLGVDIDPRQANGIEERADTIRGRGVS